MRNIGKPRARMVGVLLGIAVAGGGAALWRGTGEPPQHYPVPVPTNRGEDIRDGFRGGVHPLLKGRTRLELTAIWTPLSRGRDELEKKVPASVYRMFTDLTPAIPRKVYTEHEFSAIMPEAIPSVGQVWELRAEDMAGFLRQFHPQPSLRLLAGGRRAGPDGAFAVLRAVSPAYLDIVFRVHAEFDIAQNVWLTPACFLGRMIVDRVAGTVRYFEMRVPTDHPLNVHLTVAESMKPWEKKGEIFRKIERGDLVIARRDIVRVENMGLAGGNRDFAESHAWSDAIDMEQALHKLKSTFYASESVDWVPWNQAAAIASARGKPILAIVLWGALDDQSC